MFTHKKLAQMAIYLANKVESERIKYMRLIKLMYLADKESIAQYGEPISYDAPYSMNQGVVLSETLDIVDNEKSISQVKPWAEYFTPRQHGRDFFIGIKQKVSRDKLDHLSDADIRVLDATVEKFGKMDEWVLSDYHHDKCPEWQNPGGSSIAIDDMKMLESVGISEREASELVDRIDVERQLNRLFRLR